jgi:colanic acid/amylovoran biosynthesis protein
MRVAIVNAYNRHNAGDAALLGALIGQVRQAFTGADISFAGLESPLEHPDFEGARNVGSLRRWAGEETVGRSRRIGRKALAVGLTTLLPRRVLEWLAGHRTNWVAREPLGEIRAIAGADLVVGLGGGYLNGTDSLAGTLNVLFLLLPVWLATRLQKPTILAPQSYGPFGRPLQERMVRSCLNRVDRIVVREDISLAVLKDVGVRPDLLERGVDSAFALGENKAAAVAAPVTDDEPGHPRVGITARAWLPGPGQESYERSLAAFVDWLHLSRGAFVTLVPQVTSSYRGDDDRLVSRRVASYCTSAPQVIDIQLDHEELRAVYGGLDYVVGTRFHSVIFSLTTGTPALAIEYEHKTSGIMGDLGLDDWVVPILEVTGPLLCARFAALERGRSDYERLIKERLPDYVSRAQGFVGVLRGSVR